MAITPAQTLSPELLNLTGREKAAGLLIGLGPEITGNILKLLPEGEVDKITTELLNMERLDPAVRDAIFEEAYQLSLGHEYVSQGGVDFARDALIRALGKEKAGEILDKITSTLQETPFAFIKKADPVQLVSYIQNEHPQTLALILANLTPIQSAAILSSLDPSIQPDVARRIALMDRTSPEVISQVEGVLKRKLGSVLTQEVTTMGGLDYLVKVLNNVDRVTEKTVLDGLDQDSPDLAEDIKKHMFVFENITMLDDRSIQRVLKEVDSKELGLAMKGASESVKQRIFKNMSSRAADMLREDMAVTGPVRLRNVEEAQQRIVKIIRRLEEADEIVIQRGGAADLVV
ncbi:MAG TPA: flagellar motor switch protein FliG [Chloroflexota bacterium]|jgi:flagellar motor switch protein FliG|nr:flagellar motor switch protein FliG [Chloroflexota bacterium]